jgi:hypothetical protein
VAILTFNMKLCIVDDALSDVCLLHALFVVLLQGCTNVHSTTILTAAGSKGARPLSLRWS